MWALWKMRNNMVFNAKVLSSPIVVAHKMLMLLKHSKTMRRVKDLQKTEEVIKTVDAGDAEPDGVVISMLVELAFGCWVEVLLFLRFGETRHDS
jgi:hypothetical protein